MSRETIEYFEQYERDVEEFQNLESSTQKSEAYESLKDIKSLKISTPTVQAERTKSLLDLKEEVENFRKKDTSDKVFEQGGYLGIIIAKEAEKSLKNPGQLAIYHRLPQAIATKICSKRFSSSEFLEPSPTLYLNIVYLNTMGQFQHFPISEMITADGHKLYQVNTFCHKHKVAPKNRREPRFSTIEKLLTHYRNFAYGYRFTEEGGLEIDVFPN